MNIDASMRTVLMYSKKISTSNVTFQEKKSDSRRSSDQYHSLLCAIDYDYIGGHCRQAIDYRLLILSTEHSPMLVT